MASRERWRRAQAYELDYWQRNWTPADRGSLMPPQLEFVKSCGLEGKHVLEVGCGPIGVIFFAPGSLRVGIDPLAREYAASLNLSTDGVQLLASVGENLPLAAGSFDIVVIGNVVDHVHHPDNTLAEVRRVLKPDGLVILWMHVIPRWLVPMRNILNTIDGGHPYHMTKDDAYALARRAQLEPHEGTMESTGLGWRRGWKAAAANIAMRNLVFKARPVGGREPAVAR